MSIRERSNSNLLSVERTVRRADGGRSTEILFTIPRYLRIGLVPAHQLAQLNPGELHRLKEILAKNEPAPDVHIRRLRHATSGALDEIATGKRAPDSPSGLAVIASLDELAKDLRSINKAVAGLRRKIRPRPPTA